MAEQDRKRGQIRAQDSSFQGYHKMLWSCNEGGLLVLHGLVVLSSRKGWNGECGRQFEFIVGLRLLVPAASHAVVSSVHEGSKRALSGLLRSTQRALM